MSDKAWFEIDGLQVLDAQLGELSGVVQAKILRKVIREAMQPVLSATIRNFTSEWHSVTGQLENSFGLRVRIPKNNSWADVIASVGVFTNKRLKEQTGSRMDAPVVAWWLEHGVEPHATGDGAKRARDKHQDRGIQHPGIAAKPFIRPAFDSNLEQIMASQKEALGRLIDKALEKHA
ncbi:hypothetical protein CSN29_28480 [Salmonella enterica subsp. diarizonae]|nr:hypothetical protein [Salmonella enterica subsp. diarizonae]